jgi:uncharacterized repeat protein (TIGR02543 family)
MVKRVVFPALVLLALTIVASAQISFVEFGRTLDYGDAGNIIAPTDYFELGVVADATATSVAVTSPGGQAFTIPSGEYNPDDGLMYFEYVAPLSGGVNFSQYGWGMYSITVYYAGTSHEHATVEYIGETPPTQRPVPIFPLPGQAVTSPVAFRWEPCLDPAPNNIWFDIEDPAGDEVIDTIDQSPDAEGTDAIYLFAGSYVASMGFEDDDWYVSNGVSVLRCQTSETFWAFSVVKPSDINADGVVNHLDLAILAGQWLQLPGSPSADLDGSKTVDFRDFAIFAPNWLDEGSYALHVNSSGASGVSISSSTGHGGTTNYSLTLTVGAGVTLTAPTVTDYDFTGWTGDANSSDPTISLSMDADKTVTANYVSTTITANMVLVPAGWFKYQNHATADTYCASFFIDKYEVTNAQYVAFLNTPGNDDHYYAGMLITRVGSPGSYTYTVQTGKEQFPVYYASALDAEAFAAWKSATYGGTYRLPTEQEWEKAAGWDPTLQKLWTYGYQQDVISSLWCNYNNSYGGPLVVGSFNGTGGKNLAKSYYGCYDMSGNLWEWTSSMYDGFNRVFRGGVWGYSATYCAVAYRGGTAPSFRYDSFGFRLVLGL